MKKLFVIGSMIGVCLVSALATAQADSSPAAVAVYSKCLREAVAREKTRPSPSLDRVKEACTAEYKALARELPPDLLQEITALIDEGLRRELGR